MANRQKMSLQFLMNRFCLDTRIAVLRFGIATLLLFTFSCERQASLRQFQSVDEVGWGINDTVSFSIDSLLLDDIYALSVGVRISTAHPYPYQDLLLEVTSDVSGCRVQRDTLLCDLSDLLGEGKQNGVSIYSFEQFVDTFRVARGDTCTFYVRHLMRRSPLPGIRDIGISFLPE